MKNPGLSATILATLVTACGSIEQESPATTSKEQTSSAEDSSAISNPQKPELDKRQEAIQAAIKFWSKKRFSEDTDCSNQKTADCLTAKGIKNSQSHHGYSTHFMEAKNAVTIIWFHSKDTTRNGIDYFTRGQGGWIPHSTGQVYSAEILPQASQHLYTCFPKGKVRISSAPKCQTDPVAAYNIANPLKNP